MYLSVCETVRPVPTTCVPNKLMELMVCPLVPNSRRVTSNKSQLHCFKENLSQPLFLNWQGSSDQFSPLPVFIQHFRETQEPPFHGKRGEMQHKMALPPLPFREDFALPVPHHQISRSHESGLVQPDGRAQASRARRSRRRIQAAHTVFACAAAALDYSLPGDHSRQDSATLLFPPPCQDRILRFQISGCLSSLALPFLSVARLLAQLQQ